MTCSRPLQTAPLTGIEPGTPRPKVWCATDCTSPLHSIAYTLLTYYWLLLANRSHLSLPRESGSCQTIHTYKPLKLTWVVIFEELAGCHNIKSPIKCRQRPDMTIAVDWDVKHQFKQTKKKLLNSTLQNLLRDKLSWTNQITWTCMKIRNLLICYCWG